MTENQDLPHGWAATTLCGALPIEYGKSLTRSSRSETGRIPVYGSSGQVGWHSQSLTAGPTLILGRKGSVGAVHYSPQACWPIDTTYYTEGSAAVSLKFALYLLRYAQLGRYDKSTIIPGLSRDDYNSLPVSVPPIAEQHRIVAAIEEQFTRLDAGVAALERVRANLKRYRAAVLKAAVEGKLTEEWRAQHPDVEPADVLLQRILDERRRKWEEAELEKYSKAGKTPPKGWQGKYKQPVQPDVERLPELPVRWCWATVEQLNPSERPCAYGVLQPGPDQPNGVPFVRVGDIVEGCIKTQEMKRIAPDIDAAYPRTRLHGGEVLITLVGTIGRTAVVPAVLGGANVARAVGVIPLTPRVVPSWIDIWFRNPAKRAEMTAKAHEVARKTLNLEDVRVATVALPTREEQERISGEVARLLSIVSNVESILSVNVIRSGRLRQSILKRAFEGKLVPQDPTDEPASVLLERIRQERETGQNGRGRNRTTRDGQKMQMRLVDAD